MVHNRMQYIITESYIFGDIRTSTLAEHVCWIYSGPQPIRGAGPSPAHHHMLHVGELVHPAQPGSLEQGARNPTRSVCGASGLMGRYHLVLFFLLYYIGFVSIVTNLTQHWCTGDHVPMCAGVESGYLAYILAFNIHLTVL